MWNSSRETIIHWVRGDTHATNSVLRAPVWSVTARRNSTTPSVELVSHISTPSVLYPVGPKMLSRYLHGGRSMVSRNLITSRSRAGGTGITTSCGQPPASVPPLRTASSPRSQTPHAWHQMRRDGRPSNGRIPLLTRSKDPHTAHGPQRWTTGAIRWYVSSRPTTSARQWSMMYLADLVSPASASCQVSPSTGDFAALVRRKVITFASRLLRSSRWGLA